MRSEQLGHRVLLLRHGREGNVEQGGVLVGNVAGRHQTQKVVDRIGIAALQGRETRGTVLSQQIGQRRLTEISSAVASALSKQIGRAGWLSLLLHAQQQVAEIGIGE